MNRTKSRVMALLTGLVAMGLAAGCGGDGGPTETKTPKPPEIERIVAVPSTVARGGQTNVTALASDPNDDSLSYRWSATAGTFVDPTKTRVRWTAPDLAGDQRLTVIVSDGALADTAGLDIHVGSGSLLVESEPPQAEIFLNSSRTAFLTPHRFDNLAIGEYTVQLGGNYFNFEPTDTTITLADGESKSLAFALSPPREESVITGADAMDEIGALTYVAGGIGVLYTARIGAETSLRTASLFPPATPGNGRVLFNGLHLDEAISLRPVPFANDELALVFGDDIHIGQLVDLDVDGLMDRMDGPLRLNGLAGSGYAPAFSPDGKQLAFALMPSTQPNDADFLYAADYDSVRVNRLRRVASRGGNSPSYGPNDLVIFEAGGELYQAFVDTLRPAVAEQITTTGGFARKPVISPDGRHVAYVDARGAVMILAPDVRMTANVKPDARTTFVAWSPDGRELLIADNAGPGLARLLLLTDLPIP